MSIYKSINQQCFADTTNPIINKQDSNQLSNKNYSLQPDFVTGWIPKMKVIGPIPLNFDYYITDYIIQTLNDNQNKISYYQLIYLGSRPHNTFKLHEEMSKYYHFKYQHLYKNNYSHLQPFFKKFYNEFQSNIKRPFKGMNPNVISSNLQAIFDSQFECGNLDAAIRVNRGEYDLFLRIDSNTRGHLQWYYFKVKNINLLKIKLNIVNFKRNKVFYQSGMKPFFKRKDHDWKQYDKNVTFKQIPLRYDFLQDNLDIKQYTFKQLSFEYQFSNLNQVVEFAYCVPYQYSRMINFCTQLQYSLKDKNIFNSKVLCDSLSGLELPILTITNNISLSKINKKCIFVIARQHPGQSNSSFVMEGFLKWIVSDSPAAFNLRQISVIRIVPMMNPDGVILGNFRTSLCGKDLNRLFKAKNYFMYPQVQALKLQIQKTKNQFEDRFSLFLDLHGHSLRKNVFCYGPGFNISNNNYYKARIFPKMIADNTYMFRYYSCTFRMCQQKLSTARAVFSKFVPFSYTIESSNWSYYQHQNRNEQVFDAQKWEEMGRYIGISVEEYLNYMLQEQKQVIMRLEKFKQKKEVRKNRDQKIKQQKIQKVRLEKIKWKQFSKNQSQQSPSKKIPNQLQTSKNIKKLTNVSIIQSNNTNKNLISQNQLIQSIKQLQQNQNNPNKQDNNDIEYGEQDSSDGISQDLNEQQLNKFHKKVNKMVIQFKKEFLRQNGTINQDNQSLKEVRIKKLKKNNQRQKEKKQKKKKNLYTNNIEVIACMRKKMMTNKVDYSMHEQKKCEVKQYEIIPVMKSFRFLKENENKKKISRIEFSKQIKQQNLINQLNVQDIFKNLKKKEIEQNQQSKFQEKSKDLFMYSTVNNFHQEELYQITQKQKEKNKMRKTISNNLINSPIKDDSNKFILNKKHIQSNNHFEVSKYLKKLSNLQQHSYRHDTQFNEDIQLKQIQVNYLLKKSEMISDIRIRNITAKLGKIKNQIKYKSDIIQSQQSKKNY